MSVSVSIYQYSFVQMMLNSGYCSQGALTCRNHCSHLRWKQSYVACFHKWRKQFSILLGHMHDLRSPSWRLSSRRWTSPIALHWRLEALVDGRSPFAETERYKIHFCSAYSEVFAYFERWGSNRDGVILQSLLIQGLLATMFVFIKDIAYEVVVFEKKKSNSTAARGCEPFS